MKHQHFLGNQDLVLYRFIIFPPGYPRPYTQQSEVWGTAIKGTIRFAEIIMKNYISSQYFSLSLYYQVQIPLFGDFVGLRDFYGKGFGLDNLYQNLCMHFWSILLRDDGCSLMSWHTDLEVNLNSTIIFVMVTALGECYCYPRVTHSGPFNRQPSEQAL